MMKKNEKNIQLIDLYNLLKICLWLYIKIIYKKKKKD